MDEVSVLIVDDEALIRGGLKLLLDGANGLRVVGEAGDGAEALRKVAQLDPDVVLMDVRMPTMDGLQATRQLLQANPERRVVMLTTFDADETVLTALGYGAVGFLLKDTSPADLVAGIRSAAAGDLPLSPTVTRRLVAHALRDTRHPVRTRARSLIADLTDRERDIAQAVAGGASNQEIAESMYIGLATVKTHVGRVMTKLEAANRTQVALRVYEADLDRN